MNAADSGATVEGQGEIIDALQRRLDDFEAKLGSKRPSRRRRTGLAMGAALVLVLGAVGVAVATISPPNESEAGYVDLVPAKKVLSSKFISGNNASASVVVRGGSSTVPTNASAVKLNVIVTATKSGILRVASDTGQRPVIYASGTSAGTTVYSRVGAADKLKFTNDGSASVKVTATITGYTQQVAFTDVYGGSASAVYTTHAGGGTTIVPHGSNVVVASLSVPAGTYAATWSAVVTGDNVDACTLEAPGEAGGIATKNSSTQPDSVSMTAVLVLQSAGSINVKCAAGSASAANAQVFLQSLVAIPQQSYVGQP